jgi:hypothetical protein
VRPCGYDDSVSWLGLQSLDSDEIVLLSDDSFLSRESPTPCAYRARARNRASASRGRRRGR